MSHSRAEKYTSHLSIMNTICKTDVWWLKSNLTGSAGNNIFIYWFAISYMWKYLRKAGVRRFEWIGSKDQGSRIIWIWQLKSLCRQFTFPQTLIESILYFSLWRWAKFTLTYSNCIKSIWKYAYNHHPNPLEINFLIELFSNIF